MTEPLTAPSHSELLTVTPLPAPCPLQAVPSGLFCNQNQSQHPPANLTHPLLRKAPQLPCPPELLPLAARGRGAAQMELVPSRNGILKLI